MTDLPPAPVRAQAGCLPGETFRARILGVSGPGFDERVRALPRLGLGISTEHGAGREGLDVLELRRRRPDLLSFLEIGADLARGIDDDARAWIAAGLPATYHFLDVNLEEPEDLDEAWMRDTAALARECGAAWLCGDAGLWHVGPRDRGHGTLLPPVLVPESADAVGASVARLREATGFEVCPENPPSHAWLGRMHLLEYFARACEAGDTGMLLDAAHVAVFQHARGHEPLDGFDDFPASRVVEIHVAGGRAFEHGGASFIEDDHGVEVLDATWEILEHVLPRATNLRAVVVEAERNRIDEVVPLFERVRSLVP
jgi:uncharacterized protein (UPF0276 family)